MCFMTCFFIWLPEKRPHLCAVILKTIFYLKKKKLIPIEKLKKALCEKRLFFALTFAFQFVFHRVIFCVSPQVFFVCIQKLSVSLEDIN